MTTKTIYRNRILDCIGSSIDPKDRWIVVRDIKMMSIKTLEAVSNNLREKVYGRTATTATAPAAESEEDTSTE